MPGATRLIQGVSTRTLSLTSYRAGKAQREQFGENASYQHGRGRTVGISRLRPQSPALRDPSVSARNDRFVIHESTYMDAIAEHPEAGSNSHLRPAGRKPC